MTLFSKFRRSKRSSDKPVISNPVKPVYRHVPTHAAQDALTATPFIYSREECSRKIGETRQRTKEINRAQGIGTPKFASKVVLRQNPGEPRAQPILPKPRPQAQLHPVPRRPVPTHAQTLDYGSETPRKGQPYFSHVDSPTWVRARGLHQSIGSFDGKRSYHSPSVYSPKHHSSPSVESEFSKGTDSPRSVRNLPAHHPRKHYALDSPDCGEYRGPPMRPLFVPPAERTYSPTPTLRRTRSGSGDCNNCRRLSRCISGEIGDYSTYEDNQASHERERNGRPNIREQSRGPQRREQSRGAPQERRNGQFMDRDFTAFQHQTSDRQNQSNQPARENSQRQRREQSRGPVRDQNQWTRTDQSQGQDRGYSYDPDTYQPEDSRRPRSQVQDVERNQESRRGQSQGPGRQGGQRFDREQSQGPNRDRSRGPPRERVQSGYDAQDHGRAPRQSRDQSRGPRRDANQASTRSRSLSRPRSSAGRSLNEVDYSNHHDPSIPPLPTIRPNTSTAEASRRNPFVPSPLFSASTQNRRATAHAALNNFSRPGTTPATTNFSRPAQQTATVATANQVKTVTLPLPPAIPTKQQQQNPAGYLSKPPDRPATHYTDAKGTNFGAGGRPSNVAFAPVQSGQGTQSVIKRKERRYTAGAAAGMF